METIYSRGQKRKGLQGKCRQMSERQKGVVGTPAIWRELLFLSWKGIPTKNISLCVFNIETANKDTGASPATLKVPVDCLIC